MIIRAVLVSDDVRDFCDDHALPHPPDVDAWLAAHEAELVAAMDAAAKAEIHRLLKEVA